MRGATSGGKPPIIEPTSLTDRGTAEEITGRPDSDREEWDTEWAAECAAEAMHFLAEHYPECSNADNHREDALVRRHIIRKRGPLPPNGPVASDRGSAA